MNRLIPGALFSKRAAEEQMLRERELGVMRPGSHRDVSDQTSLGSRAAKGFRKHDPDGRKSAKLFQQPD
jgi:hypothetical protein